MGTEYTKGQKLKVRTDYDGCEYITAGRIYDAEVLCDELPTLVGFSDDEGDHVACLVGAPCSHLDEHDAWEVVS